MIIIINNEKVLTVNESFLVVKDKKLYNTKTKEYEGVDGDIVSFERNNGHRVIITRGTVDGYTCGNNIKLNGVSEPFTDCKKIHYEHISVVTLKEGVTEEELEEQAFSAK